MLDDIGHRGEFSFRLDIRRIFSPVPAATSRTIAAGERLAHLAEPRGESLETDLGTVNKLLHVNISIQNTCSFFNSFHAM